MKRRVPSCLVKSFCLVALAVVLFGKGLPIPAFASELSDSLGIEEILKNLDLSHLKDFFQTIALPENLTFDALVQDAFAGEMPIDFSSLGKFFITILLKVAKDIVPILMLSTCVLLLISLFNGIKSDFAPKSISNVIQFVSVVLVGGLLCYKLIDLFQTVSSYTDTISRLIYAVFPPLFTLLSSLGAGASVLSFQQTATVFVTIVVGIVPYILVPICLYAVAFSIVGNLSTELGKSKFHTFFLSVGKTALFTVFFLFSAFCGLQSILTTVYDSIGIRLARFSLSKYVPIIGGYLSEGFQYLFAGGVLVKNTVGIAFLLLLLAAFLPILCEMLVFLLSTKLLRTLASTLSEVRVCEMVKGMEQSISTLLAGVVGLTVCAGVFCAIVLLSCNGVIA